MIFRHTAPFTFGARLKRLVAKLFTPPARTPEWLVSALSLSPQLLCMCVLCENALFSKGRRLLLRGHAEERETINRPAFYADGNKIKALVCSLFVPSAQKHTETQ
jgi:hypothetical protein